MSAPTLKPCPFCGEPPELTERPDNSEGTAFFCAVGCFCGSYSATAHRWAVRPTAAEAKADAVTAWNTRAAPADVPEYGATDFGWSFAGMSLADGDKRLMALIVHALGSDHPAVADLVALIFRAAHAPAPADAQHQPKGMPLSDEQLAVGVVENGCGLGSGQLPDVAFIKGAKWGAAQVQSPAPAHAETMTLQEVWNAMGGNPGIAPSRADVLLQLKLLDQICDEADDKTQAPAVDAALVEANDFAKQLADLCQQHEKKLLAHMAREVALKNYETAMRTPLFQQARAVMGTENEWQDNALRAAILHYMTAPGAATAQSQPPVQNNGGE